MEAGMDTKSASTCNLSGWEFKCWISDWALELSCFPPYLHLDITSYSIRMTVRCEIKRKKYCIQECMGLLSVRNAAVFDIGGLVNQSRIELDIDFEFAELRRAKKNDWWETGQAIDEADWANYGII